MFSLDNVQESTFCLENGKASNSAECYWALRIQRTCLGIKSRAKSHCIKLDTNPRGSASPGWHSAVSSELLQGSLKMFHTTTQTAQYRQSRGFHFKSLQISKKSNFYLFASSASKMELTIIKVWNYWFPLNIELVHRWRSQHGNSTAVKNNSYETWNLHHQVCNTLSLYKTRTFTYVLKF